MAWDRELQALEQAIRNLTAEYDAFLYGSACKPPIEGRKHLEQMVRRLSAGEPDSSADRYRFTTLQGRYNALCDRWDRLQTEKEAGRRPGLYGRFTRGQGVRPERAEASPNDQAAASVQAGGEPARQPERELFEKYIGAKKALGENVSGYDFAGFLESLKRERERLKERFGGVEIEFDVAERDGRVRLVAKRRPSFKDSTGKG